jgi:hypothetical protein
VKGSGKTIGDNKRKNSSRLKREPFAYLLSRRKNFPDFSLGE